MRYRRLESKLQDAMMFGGSRYVEPSGFAENFQAAVGMTVLDNLSWSGAFWHDRKEERRQKLYELQKSGVISEAEVNQYRGYDNEFAKYLQEKYGIEDVLTDEQIMKKNKMEEKELLGYGREVQSRATFMGKVGGFLGNLPAYALDPIYSLSMFIPVGHAARGASLLTRTALRAGGTAVTEGALELARQPMIYNWKKDIGRDYNWKEGLSEVAMAVVGAGFMGGAAELATGIRKFNAKVKPRSAADHLMVKDLEDTARIMERAPEGVSAADHLKALDDEINYLNAERKATVEPEVEVSARAEPSVKYRDLYEGSSEAKAFEARINEAINNIPENIEGDIPTLIEAAVTHMDEATGDLVDNVRPIREAIKEMDDLNKSFQQTWDCLFAA